MTSIYEPAPAHLRDLRRLLEHVLPEDNCYSNTREYVHWPGVNGFEKYACHADCCGLLDELLIHSYGYTRNDLKMWLGEFHPRATTYFQAIVRSNRFSTIAYIGHVLPGDVIALSYPPGLKSNGHILFVNALPQARESTLPIIQGTNQWAVEIIDCTGSCHGIHDTRHSEDEIRQTGVGKGIFRLYTAQDGLIIGYTWCMKKTATFHGQDDRKIVVGRFIPK